MFASSVGMDSRHMDPSMAVVYLNHVPDATNIRTMVHMAQMFRNGDKFYKYDFGTNTNLLVYGTTTPQEYMLNNVKAPTALFSGDADGFVTKEDVDILSKHLPNVILNHRINFKGFAHLDFIFGIGAKSFLNEKIVAVMNDM